MKKRNTKKRNTKKGNMKINDIEYYFDEDDEVIERKDRRRKRLHRILIAICIVVAAIALFILVFHTRKIDVSGNEYCTAEEVKAWIQKDKLSYNSLYTWWKFNYTGAEQLPTVDEMEITMVKPWKISVRVYEKSIIGYLDFDGTHVYFDKDGVVLVQTTDTLDGIPCIEGITVDSKKIVVHEELPVKKTTAFNNVFEVAQAMETNSVSADRITLSESGEVTMNIGNVTVSLGNTGFADKVAQIPPILAKLQENYPDQAGTLHLENYSKSHTSISFTPE